MTNKNMAIGAETQSKSKKKSPINKENQNKILRAYIAMYNVFLLQNLMAGKTLGAASHAALLLLTAKIATMDKKNPVTKLLRRIHRYHSKQITRVIMTCAHRDTTAKIRPDERTKLAAFISKKFNEATKTLNAMSTQYKPKAISKKPATNAPASKSPRLVAATVRVKNQKLQQPQKQKMVLQLWMRRQQNQRSAA